MTGLPTIKLAEFCWEPVQMSGNWKVRNYITLRRESSSSLGKQFFSKDDNVLSL